MKTLYAFIFLFSAIAHAENIPVKIHCEGADGFVVESAKSNNKELSFSKRTMLDVTTAKGEKESLIIQNEDFDLDVSNVAHLTGEPESGGNYFDLKINFETGKGLIDIDKKKTELKKCHHEKW